MRRIMLIAPVVAAVLLAVLLFLRPVASSGQVAAGNGKAAG